MNHKLKTWPNAWRAVREQTKRFEWRKDDRGFEVGDVLELYLYDPQDPDRFMWEDRVERGTVPVCRVEVTYILRGAFDMPPGYCVMSIKPIGQP